MDYKELLKKYILHVGLCEGSIFLEDYNRTSCDMPVFTDEEWLELQRIATEAQKEVI